MKDQNIIRQRTTALAKAWNPRRQAMTAIIFAGILLTALLVSSLLIFPDGAGVDFQIKNQAPSWAHPFGTDWLGRDMLIRTVKGLSLSFGIGLLAALASVLIALMFSLAAAYSKIMDSIVTWLIDLFLGLPHLVILILISFALGGGYIGVVVGIALSHWPRLTRLLRSEVIQVKNMEYVAISRKMGKSKWAIALQHGLPHLMPQLVVGFILLFPHAILHEAAITFLGFGLSSDQPAIGVILSESMRYLSTGMWWLAFFPGLMLLIMVGIFDSLGRNIHKLIDPFNGQKL